LVLAKTVRSRPYAAWTRGVLWRLGRQDDTNHTHYQNKNSSPSKHYAVQGYAAEAALSLGLGHLTSFLSMGGDARHVAAPAGRPHVFGVPASERMSLEVQNAGPPGGEAVQVGQDAQTHKGQAGEAE
jgi:hypothetical protein